MTFIDCFMKNKMVHVHLSPRDTYNSGTFKPQGYIQLDFIIFQTCRWDGGNRRYNIIDIMQMVSSYKMIFLWNLWYSLEIHFYYVQ